MKVHIHRLPALIPVLLAAIAASCGQAALPLWPAAPAFVSEGAEPEVKSAELNAMTDGGKGIVRCGFHWGAGGTLTGTAEAELEDGGGFSTILKGLKPDTEYSYCAFISNGINELRSDTLTFRTLENLEPENPGAIIPLPDNIISQYVINGYDSDGDGRITVSEAAEVQGIELCSDGLASPDGIEYFPNLEKLCLDGSHEDWPLTIHGTLADIDLSGNTELTFLELNYNPLRSIDLSWNRKLQFIYIVGCPLEAIDLSNCPDLVSIAIASCSLTELDLSANGRLEEVHIDKNTLRIITIGENTNLRYLDCHENNLVELDLSGCSAMKDLDCSGNPDLETLILKKGQMLKSITKDPHTEIVYCQ